MTGLDEAADFWEWVRENPPETIEAMILQHVRINRRGNSKGNAYEVTDMDGNVVATVTISSREAKKKDFSPAAAITQALLANVICTKCGTKLLAGEKAVCSTCEASQVMDLIRLQRELTE